MKVGWQTIIDRQLPAAGDIQRTKVWKEERPGYLEFGDLITLTTHGEQLPIISLYPKATAWNQEVVLWVDGNGKSGLFSGSELNSDVRRLIDAGYSVVGLDMAGQGEFTTNREPLTENPVVDNPRPYAGYTYTYNNTLFVQRVHDLLTVTAWINGDEHSPEALHAVGVNGAGALLATARALTGEQLTSVAIATDGFRFADLLRWQDARFVPGAVKYGDLPTLLSLSAPHRLWVGSESDPLPIVTSAYEAAGAAEQVVFGKDSGSPAADAVTWLLQQ